MHATDRAANVTAGQPPKLLDQVAQGRLCRQTRHVSNRVLLDQSLRPAVGLGR
jgi:hypothetical protein